MHVTPRSRSQVVQLLGLVLRQAAGRLVEDNDAGTAAHRRSDLQHLLLRRCEDADLAPYVDRCTDRGKHLFGTFGHRALRNEPSFRRQCAEAQVLGH
jgi:hypothetical protein